MTSFVLESGNQCTSASIEITLRFGQKGYDFR